MNVLSLFDGISSGRVALERNNIKVNKYYASEIDKYAITVSKKNYPDIIQLGDIIKWREWSIDWSSINLVFAGFPCQAWSIAGKQFGDKDERGMLFWIMLDVLSHVKKHNPDVQFIIENVKMKREFEQYITEHTEKTLGKVNKYLINSSLVSAQNRQRYYWTSISGVTQPEDKGILLKDIVDCGYVDRDKSHCIDANYHKGGNLKSYLEKNRRQLVFLLDDKADLIKRLASIKNNLRKDFIKKQVPLPNNIEITVKPGQFIYTNHLGQNGSLVKDKCATLVCSSSAHVITDDLRIRKLTPEECEKLQTLDIKYTEGVSNSQRYKCLGNGWTVDVICHILKFGGFNEKK